MTEFDVGRPAWVDDLTKQRPGSRPLSWQEDAHSPHGGRLMHSLPGGSSGQRATISFEGLPPGEEVGLTVQGLGTWEIRNVDARSKIRVTRADPDASHTPSALHLDESVKGTVAMFVMANCSSLVKADEECGATLALLDGVYAPIEVGPNVVVELRGGVLAGGAYGAMVLLGNAEIGGGSDPVDIASLSVRETRNLTVPSSGRQIRFGRLSGDGEGAGLDIVKAESRLPSSQNPTLSVSVLQDLTVSAQALMVVKAERVTDATLKGNVAVEIGRLGVAENVTFEAMEKTMPLLSAGNGSTLMGVTGDLNLAKVAGAHVEGGDDGFHIAKIRAQPGAVVTAAQTDFCKDAFISGFRLPSGLDGRSLLNVLAEAHHLEPHACNLPGWEYRATRSNLRPESPPSRRDAQHDAELMRELRRLTHEKGASGAVRTKVGWCAQRLRHLTTTGRVEGLALAAYRMLGYGERPMPAFGTWLVLSAVVAAGVLVGNWEWPGVGRALAEIGHQAFGPISAVSRAGAPTPDADWVYVARAVVAIPLVTGALSLRHYVRAG